MGNQQQNQKPTQTQIENQNWRQTQTRSSFSRGLRLYFHFSLTQQNVGLVNSVTGTTVIPPQEGIAMGTIMSAPRPTAVSAGGGY